MGFRRKSSYLQHCSPPSLGLYIGLVGDMQLQEVTYTDKSLELNRSHS